MKTSEDRRAVRTFINSYMSLILLLSLCALIPTTSQAQRRREAQILPGAQRNPAIARIVSEIDARNIESSIRKLVSFGTRNTLSAQDNPSRGIGAARDWLYAEFQKI